jgi:hypothetical protein
MISRNWRSALLQALIVSAIAIGGGALPALDGDAGAIASGVAVPHIVVICDGQSDSSASHHWNASFSDDDSGDSADDDDDDPDDAPTAVVAPAADTLTGDHVHTLLSTYHETDRRTAFVSDGHSLRAPPQ